jgi:glycosyltransferase involved in cell wall biosynthesis
MNPSVSIVIPAYNHERFIAEAITSVLNQSFTDFEIVITDDGSADGTVDAIRRISDPRIKLETFGKNRGAAVALNSAILRSRGEFLCYLSSDDFFLPSKLETQVRFLRQNPGKSAVFGLPHFIDERGNALSAGNQFNGEVFDIPFKKNITTSEDWLRHFFFYCNCLCHPTIMIRRTVYDGVGLFDPRLTNLPDFDMWVRLCIQQHEIALLADKVTAMRILDGNRNMSAPIRDNLVRTNFEYFEILKHYRRLSLDALKDIFAVEITANGLTGIDSAGLLLAELALTSSSAVHALFGLDTMFHELSTRSEDGFGRLRMLTANRDVFGVDLGHQLHGAAGELAKIRDAAKGDEARIAQLNAEIAELNVRIAELEARTAQLNVRNVELDTTIAQLNTSIERVQANAARLLRMIDLADIEIGGLQRSKTFALLRLQKSFRERIERLSSALKVPPS